MRHTRPQTLRQDGILDLIRKLEHAVNLLLALLPLQDERFELRVHGVFAAQERIDLVFLDRKPRFHRLLARPVLAVSFTFDEDLRNKCRDSVRTLHKGKRKMDELTCLMSTSPYQRRRIASAPSVFSKRPR